MKIRLSKRLAVVLTSLLLMVGVILTVVEVQRQQLLRQEAWSIQATAVAECNEDGTVTIAVNFTNTEQPANNGSKTMRVQAKDLQSNKTVDLGDIEPGDTNIGRIDTGMTEVQNGVVEFKLTWTDGRSGDDTKHASYPAVASCGVVPTPTIPACIVTQAICEWTPGDDNASIFSVTITDKNGQIIKEVEVPSDTTKVTFPAKPGMQYTCSVVASNDCGTSEPKDGESNVCPLPTPTPTDVPSVTPSPTNEPTPINEPTPTPTDEPTPTMEPSPTDVTERMPTKTPTPTRKPTQRPPTPTITPRPTIQLWPTAPKITQPPPVIVNRPPIIVTQIVVAQQNPPAQQPPVQHPPQQPQPLPTKPVTFQITPVRSVPTARPNIPPSGIVEDTILVFAGAAAATVIGGIVMWML